MLIVFMVVGAAVLLAIGASLLYAYIKWGQYRVRLAKESTLKPVDLLSKREVTNNGNPRKYNEELELFFKEIRDNTRKYVQDNLLSLYKNYISDCHKDFKFVPAEVELSFDVVVDSIVYDAFERCPADADLTMTSGDMTLSVNISINRCWDKLNNCYSPLRYIKVRIYNVELE